VTSEDAEIEVMESMEMVKVALADQDKAFATAKQLAGTRARTLEDKIVTMQKRLSDLGEERKTLGAAVEDGDLLYRYGRLFDKKNGTPVMPVEHEVCMGCHMKITAQVFHKVRAGKELTYCEQCGRILYYE